MPDSPALTFDTEVAPPSPATLESRDRGSRDHREQQTRRQAHDNSDRSLDDPLNYESEDHKFEWLV